MLSKFCLLVVCLGLLACSGNNSSSKTTPDITLKRFSGVVNNSSVYGVAVTVNPIGAHGRFRLNKDNNLDSISLVSDDQGRYGVLLKTKEKGVYVITATAPNADTEAAVKVDPAKMQCQVVAGCANADSAAQFGSTYPMPAKSQWSAGVEFVSNGQFVVLNPITEMATVFGASTYVNSPADLVTTTVTIDSVNAVAKPGYYSSFGVIKGNSQVAALLGVPDIVSIEPVNLFLLHDVTVNGSNSLKDSIRYGALLAGWQQLELAYNKEISEGDFTFQQQAIFDFISNQGQLYQAAPLDNQKLSMKAWYEAAVANLIAARDFHGGLSRSTPKEVNLVIASLQDEISQFKDGVLTVAKPTIPVDLENQYKDAVSKSKAMVNYISDLKNNFASEEFRDSVQATSALATEEIKRLSPNFDALMKDFLSIQKYYLSCTHQSCDVSSPWHSSVNTYTAGTKTLEIVQAGGAKLVLSQAKVFTETEPEGASETHAHNLLITGALENSNLRIELSNLVPEKGAPILSAMRFAFSKVLAEIPEQPALVDGGSGSRVDESLVPDVIELILPAFKLFDKSTQGSEAELTVSGALRAVLIANVGVDDFRDNLDITEKLGKRYNLSNVDATLRLVAKKEGELANSTELRDNAVISLSAVASEAVAGPGNPAAFFPDTVYPSFESFFKPREGFTVDTPSAADMVVSRRGVMDFPKLNSDGSLVEGGVPVEVAFLELDYEIGGLDRYVVYPKIGQDEKFLGLLCSAVPGDEQYLQGREWTRVEKNSKNEDVTRALLTCNVRNKYSGDATPDVLINAIYAINKDVVSLRDYNGQGAYRMAYPTSTKTIIENDKEKVIEILKPFPEGERAYPGVIEQTIVLGVDSMRLQVKPEFVNNAATGFLPNAALDVNLIWRKHDVIDVNIFLAFNSDENFNNPNGSGLPFIGVGSDVESYSVAYRKIEGGAEDGNEVGEFNFAWSGVHFVDGPINGEKIMQRTSDENLKEGVIAGIGSNVNYRPYTPREEESLKVDDITKEQEEACGFFERGQKTDEGENCDAIAYLTFRGFVTGTLREESDGAYVIRYIDGTWQVLGVK